MRVLLANKYFHPRGGAERAFFLSDRLLREAGHEVVHLSVQDPQNLRSPWSDRFLDPVRHDRPAWHPASWRAGWRALGLGVRAKVRRLLDAARPDVALLHNVYHQLGAPGLLDELGARRIPAAMILHDYRVVCPAHALLRRGVPCEACAGGAFLNAAWGGCGGSRARGLLLAWSAARERSRLRHVRRFAAPSRFLIEKARAMGFPHPIALLRNAVELPASAADPAAGQAFGYAGRLAPEKGLDVLLAAAREAPELAFRIAGDGPLRAQLARNSPSNVTLLGPLDPDALARERATWRAEVVPSVCYENCPLSALEAFALGLPVVASDLGALREIVAGRGVLFAPGDPRALAASLRTLAADGQLARALGAAGREFAGRECAADAHRDALVGLLEETRGS